MDAYSMATANNDIKDMVSKEAEKKVQKSSQKKDGMSDKKQPFIKRRSVPNENDRKNIHMILKGNGVARLKNLKADLSMDSNTEVFQTALEVLDLLVYEHNEGSQILLKRTGESPVPLEIFEH